MRSLSLNFMILQYCGLWQPYLCSAVWKFVLYKCYTCVVIFLIYTFIVSEVIELITAFESVDEFARGSFMLLSMIGVCGKMVNVIVNRRAINDLINDLNNDVCAPRSSNEAKIQADCERDARSNTFRYTTLTASAAIFILLRSIVVDLPENILPFKGWLPYAHNSSRVCFLVAYFHQFFASGIGAVINISIDTLIPGLFILICAQMRILIHRIETIPRMIEKRTMSLRINHEKDYCKIMQSAESELLKDCIRHHDRLNIRLAQTSNDIFGLVVSLQFAVSSLVLCVSVYEVSNMDLFTAEFTAILMYLLSMLVQIFIFCFYGGELSNQSMDICNAVYKMDWSSFSLRTKKSLIIMMLRSQRPITFICSHEIVLSLGSFGSLIKLSYSAYNVLKDR